MKREYVPWEPSAKCLERIERANQIIEEYEAAGDTLTLRQLHYQHVSRFPDVFENTFRNYKNLGTLMTKARDAGLVSWTAFEDRHRSTTEHYVQESVDTVIDGLEHHIQFDPWERQDHYVEVWIEKDALIGVIERPCDELRVPYMACKGNMSSSAIWEAGQRFRKARDRGKECVLVHLGDHDPSGIDMTRDNADRLHLYSESTVNVRRIALNMDQVEEYDPPPNPVKEKDTRSPDYIARFGQVSWELDALEPSTIRELITREVRRYIDHEAWDETLSEELITQERFVALREFWRPEVVDLLDELRPGLEDRE